jgi:hypothetical protein
MRVRRPEPSVRNAAPPSVAEGVEKMRYWFFPANETRKDESGVVKRIVEREPSVRASETEEPFTPEASVKMLAAETAMSEIFCGRKKPAELVAMSA